MELADLGVKELSDLFREKKLSPVEYAKDMSKRIQEERLNCIATFDEKLCMDMASESEERYMKGAQLSPIDGIPIGIKDIIDTHAIRTTYGCNAYLENYPEKDAFVVEQLLKAGANISVKTNTCQFAMGPTGEVSLNGPVRNASNPDYVTGGSSSGSASAVKAKLVPCALGTDSGGSIRLPSAVTGVIGVKPTFGLVSNRGVMPVCESVDVVGPITRNVIDGAMVLNEIAGYNKRDWRSAPVPKKDYTELIGSRPEKVRAVIGREFFNNPIVDPFVKERCLRAVGIMKDLGFETEEKDLGDLSELRNCHQILMMASAHFVHKVEIEKYRKDVYDQVYKRLTSGDVTSDVHINNELNKNKMVDMMNDAMEGYDVFVLPTTPLRACKIGEGEKEISINGKRVIPFTTYGSFTWIASYCNWPGINIPVGTDENGLPAGITLLARPFHEEKLFQVAEYLVNSL